MLLPQAATASATAATDVATASAAAAGDDDVDDDDTGAALRDALLPMVTTLTVSRRCHVTASRDARPEQTAKGKQTTDLGTGVSEQTALSRQWAPLPPALQTNVSIQQILRRLRDTGCLVRSTAFMKCYA